MNEITIHTTMIGDVEDPDIAMIPLLDKFCKTEKYQWLHENNILMKYRFHDTFDFYHTVEFVAEFYDEELEFMYKLKFGNDKKHMVSK